jgi:hypothetical protein
VEPFKHALEVIAGVMRDGVATHPDNEWVRRSVDYHLGRAEEHLRLLREDRQLAAQQREIDVLKQQDTSINVLSERLAALEQQVRTATPQGLRSLVSK